MNWTCKRGLLLCGVELEVTRVHANVCVLGGHSQERTSENITSVLGDTPGTGLCWKQKEEKGAGICCLGVHARNTVVIELLSTAYLRTAGFLFCGFCFVVWVFFNSTLE